MYEPKDHVPYNHREYPKWVYKDGDGIIVNDASEHDAAKEEGYGEYSGKSVDLEAEEAGESVEHPVKPIKPNKKSKKVESE